MATATAVPPAEVVHSTLADFLAPCVATDGTLATSAGDGAVGLDGAFRDGFDGASLDGARWASGSWSGGGYTPSVSGGVLQVAGANGAYVRSRSTFSGQTLEGVASFGAGPWQHLGFGSQDFEGDRYLLFSTFNGSSNLYARTNTGQGEQRTDLGALPAGFHTYRVEWVHTPGSSAEVRYFIDGALRASHTTAAVTGLYSYASYNSGSAPALQVDALRVLPPYVASGSFTSCTLDAGVGLGWASLSWSASLAAGTSVGVEVRSSPDGQSWGAWSAASSGAALGGAERFLQYRLTLASADPAVSPLVDAVTMSRVFASP